MLKKVNLNCPFYLRWSLYSGMENDMSKIDLENILSSYIDKFNLDDNECYKQDINNENVKEWMKENVPYFTCPDKTIEEIYYFRWWVARKHIRTTEDGVLITEFLPEVPWAGKHNTIVAAAGHHIAEFKWLKCGKKILNDYISFWLEKKGLATDYSTWLLHAIYEFCEFENDYSLAISYLHNMISYYEEFSEQHKTESGLFWSIDGYDAMECSISGMTEDFQRLKGIRPTLNSYMAANALAISKIAKKSGEKYIEDKYFAEYARIKNLINNYLWDGEFYKAIHSENIEKEKHISVKEIENPMMNVKELIGYIPWCFKLAPDEYSVAFSEIKKEDGFHSSYGLTTAEKRHPRYLYKYPHECLWNGYIWPFATSMVLNAIINLLEEYNQEYIKKEDFYDILITYAKSHYITRDDGKTICWIDEVKDPDTNRWSSRDILIKDKSNRIYERGKDYNHSSFCDIVLRGLLGIKVIEGNITITPNIPENWNYFKLENLWICDKKYTIIYDKDGTYFGEGEGLNITQNI